MSNWKKQIALEVNYKITQAGQFPPVKLGRRITFTLDHAPTIFQKPEDALETIDRDALVLFWIAESPNGGGLVLVSVGEKEEPLVILRPDGKTTMEHLTNVEKEISLDAIGDKLGGDNTAVEDLTVWVEADENRLPLQIAKISRVETGTDAKKAYDKDVKLVLMVRRTGGYQAIYVPPATLRIGPPDLDKLLDCTNLRDQQGNLIAATIADIKGCERGAPK